MDCTQVNGMLDLLMDECHQRYGESLVVRDNTHLGSEES